MNWIGLLCLKQLSMRLHYVCYLVMPLSVISQTVKDALYDSLLTTSACIDKIPLSFELGDFNEDIRRKKVIRVFMVSFAIVIETHTVIEFVVCLLFYY